MGAFRKTVLIAVSLFLCTLPFAPAFSAERQPVYGGSLIIANDKNIQGLNPLTINVEMGNNYALFDLMMEGLLGVDRGGALVPHLAESWDVSKDGTLYTFKLRRGVKFHNGKELQAEDVKWTLEKMLDPKTRNPRRTFYLKLRSVEAKSPYEVTFLLSQPFVPFLGNLKSSSAPILPKDWLTDPPGSPVGTGPFAFVSARPGEIRLQKFKGYWQKGLPYLDEVVYRPILDETTRMVALRTGDVHVANYLPIPAVDRLIKAKDPAMKFFFQPTGLKWILFNMRQPPFNDRLMREAVAYAINKKEIMDAVSLGYAEVTNQRYPKGHKWWVDVPERPHDLEKAKSLIQRAGYPAGSPLEMITHAGDMDESVIVQSQLRKIGLDVKIKTVEYLQRDQLLEKGQYQFTFSGGGIYLDPDGFYKSRFHSEENWYMGYKNPIVDRLLSEAQVTQDESVRREQYKKVVEIIQEEAPAVFVGLTPVVNGARTALKGYEPGFFSGSFNYATGGVSRAWIEK